MKTASLYIIALLSLSIAACSEKLEVKQSTSAPAAQSESTTTNTVEAKPNEALTLSATQLFNEYKANEAAFNEKIKGKVLITSGEVSGMDKTANEQLVVHLKTADELTEAHFYMSSTTTDGASALKAGSQVKISCPKISLDLGAPKGEDCTLIK
jgi:hypothetical protein